MQKAASVKILIDLYNHVSYALYFYIIGHCQQYCSQTLPCVKLLVFLCNLNLNLLKMSLYICIFYLLLSTLDLTEKLLTGALNINTNKKHLHIFKCTRK